MVKSLHINDIPLRDTVVWSVLGKGSLGLIRNPNQWTTIPFRSSESGPLVSRMSVLKWDRSCRRIWIANQRIHHGMLGCLFVGYGMLRNRHDLLLFVHKKG